MEPHDKRGADHLVRPASVSDSAPYSSSSASSATGTGAGASAGVSLGGGGSYPSGGSISISA